MTKEQVEEEEEEELQDLLNFAEGLDFDDYMEDLEVKSLMGALK